MALIWLILLICSAYLVGIAAWVVFSLLYLIPAGVKRGFRRTMEDDEYVRKTMGPSQELLLDKLREAFPVLAIFGEQNGVEDFCEQIRLAVQDGTQSAINQATQGYGAADPGAYAAPGGGVPGADAVRGRIMEAVLQSILPKVK